MKAFAVKPGIAHSARLMEIDSGSPGQGQVLVRTIAVGLCGTDRELINGTFGVPHPEDEYLVIGHECVGVVESSSGSELQKGEWVVPTVRRADPVPCASCARGESDMCENGGYSERGLTRLHGYLAEQFIEEPAHLVRVPAELGLGAVFVEPMSIIEKAIERIRRYVPDDAIGRCLVVGAGTIGTLAALRLRLEGVDVCVYSEPLQGRARSIVEDASACFIPVEPNGSSTSVPPESFDIAVEASGAGSMLWPAVHGLKRNGVMCLLGLASDATSPSALSDIARELVLHNKVMFGSVNSNRVHYQRAAITLLTIHRRWPGMLNRLITERVTIGELTSPIIARPRELKLIVDFELPATAI